jgi:hypothetical protein
MFCSIETYFQGVVDDISPVCPPFYPFWNPSLQVAPASEHGDGMCFDVMGVGNIKVFFNFHLKTHGFFPHLGPRAKRGFLEMFPSSGLMSGMMPQSWS